jgi:hypothetical protein
MESGHSDLEIGNTVGILKILHKLLSVGTIKSGSLANKFRCLMAVDEMQRLCNIV